MDVVNEEKPSTVQSVVRALSLLRAVGMSDRPMSLTDLAREAGLHPATAHRLLRTLVDTGFVYQDPESAYYSIGDAFLSLAYVQRHRLALPDIARPVLQQLVAETGETAGLAVVDGERTLVIARELSPHPLRVHAPVGGHGPLHATAVGLVLLAHLPEPVVERILSRPLQAFTDKTTTDPELLRDRLERVRRDGFAVAVEEYAEGVATIAAPVRNARMEVVAGISISGPYQRLAPPRMESLIAAVRKGAQELTTRLGAVNDD